MTALEQLTYWVTAYGDGASVDASLAYLGAFASGAAAIVSPIGLALLSAPFVLAFAASIETIDPPRRFALLGLGILCGVSLTLALRFGAAREEDMGGLINLMGDVVNRDYQNIRDILAGLFLALGAFIAFLALFWLTAAQEVIETAGGVLGGFIVGVVLVLTIPVAADLAAVAPGLSPTQPVGDEAIASGAYRQVTFAGPTFSAIANIGDTDLNWTRFALMAVYGVGLGLTLAIGAFLAERIANFLPHKERLGAVLFGTALCVYGYLVATGWFTTAPEMVAAWGVPTFG